MIPSTAMNSTTVSPNRHGQRRQGQPRTGHGMRPPLPVRARGAGARLELDLDRACPAGRRPRSCSASNRATPPDSTGYPSTIRTGHGGSRRCRTCHPAGSRRQPRPGRRCWSTPTPVTASASLVCSATVTRLVSSSVGSPPPTAVLPHCEDSTVSAGAVPRRPEHQPPRGRVQLRNACASGSRCSVGLPTEVAAAQDKRRMAGGGAAGEAPTNLTVFGAAFPASPAFALAYAVRVRLRRCSVVARRADSVGGPSDVLTRGEGAAIAEVARTSFRGVRGRPVRVSVAHRLGTRRSASRWDRDPRVPRPA